MIYWHCTECEVEFTEQAYEYCPFCGEELEPGVLPPEEEEGERGG